jgi:arylformamidase
MTIATVQFGGTNFPADLLRPIDISIPLRFNGPQPIAYGAKPATSNACESGDLIGDTRLGGSCNFDWITLTPHCNGTHTECVGHITNERISVLDCLRDVLMPGVLVSVEPEVIDGGDLVITRSRLADSLTPLCGVAGGTPAVQPGAFALIIRTLPNDERKLTRSYNQSNIPPYFTTDAMEYVVECGFKHLLVDLPSVDRIYDEGKLLNHRLFWNIEEGSFETNPNTRVESTITEMIYAANEIEDGEYLLNLQIAPFMSDASPSRPIIFKRI